MKKMLAKIISLIMILTTFIIFMPDVARAEEGNKFVQFLKKIFIYPFSATKKSTEVVTDTATKGVETVVKTGEATAGVATGDLGKIKDVVVEPVKGFVETSVTAVEGTLKMPVEAAEETEERVSGE